jgi:hypothetical protein
MVHIRRDVRIRQSELMGLFNRHSISHKHLPQEIQPPDAYRRATSDINQRTPKDMGNGTFEVYTKEENMGRATWSQKNKSDSG